MYDYVFYIEVFISESADTIVMCVTGAMENWGLVTYRETTLLVDKDNSSSAARQYVALVVGHELAHQWFGNLVTMVSAFTVIWCYYVTMCLAVVRQSLCDAAQLYVYKLLPAIVKCLIGCSCKHLVWIVLLQGTIEFSIL